MSPNLRRISLASLVLGGAGLSYAAPAAADALTLLSGGSQGAPLTVKTQILVLMTLLGLLPSLVMTMTSFLRFVIVLSLLKQALGLQQGLPGRIVTGVALVLTLLTMRPVGEAIWRDAFVPYDQDKISLQQALGVAEGPLSRFMLAQTSKTALQQIAHLSGTGEITKAEAQPFLVKLSAFVLSELKTAFQIGCMLFIPFLVIDIVVASVLMAMGMMMLSPLVISLPLKLLLFVLVDGWALTVNTLITSVRSV
ncbi:flagellar type III secretion system pore protein FliP [Paraburkholderia bonniea]|uniref:flagellar type III secretion system pore protein FliP n=1 Tax=Paraburkholderia bonniea TaxID=2152891 RepID=UPI001291D22D|nr:flagellar type III secretion system pore protein FliP [Paraburkholderia bonniea]WJF90764.1 flagellar type III secretion system pore protein FliP [Paraburkholderia bonniea]WJF94078.1 flagellar type III secretion system pore protein FliP [Paraburkholderia bonniea]